jgi:alkylated DNA repair dioxygenase AlkB
VGLLEYIRCVLSSGFSSFIYWRPTTLSHRTLMCKMAPIYLGVFRCLHPQAPARMVCDMHRADQLLSVLQDKDESSDSLQNGLPVVSFSVGDSAEFVYGKQPDISIADKVVLESGDVLIFGGPSRMIYHGVTRVVHESSPSWLIEATNLRPGRLNLTFRQH